MLLALLASAAFAADTQLWSVASTAAPEAVFAKERSKLTEEGMKPLEQLTLEPFEVRGWGRGRVGRRGRTRGR